MSTQPSPPLRAGLSHPAYNTPTRVRGWKRPLKAKSAPLPIATKRILQKLAPHWSKADHASLAKYHNDRAEKLDAVWILVANRAALQAFSRRWRISDYKICAIGRIEFAARHKRVLRHCAYRGTEHKMLAMGHAEAAGRPMLLARPTTCRL